MISTQSVQSPKSSIHYLSNLGHSPTTYSPNQHLLPFTAKVDDQGHLEVGGCNITQLVQNFASPLYILDETTLRIACRQYRNSLRRYYPQNSQVLYASKAWNCQAICAIVVSEGLGIDVMSGGELYTALQAGVSAEQIYLHGNNKSRAELELAIESGCSIIVDNWLELHTLVDITQAKIQAHKFLKQPLQIMLRLTPGIECHTHKYVLTGHLDSKFGFDSSQLPEVFTFISQHPELSCVGLHAHIGSQLFQLQPYQDLAEILVQWMAQAADYGLSITTLNVGGGLGICYTENDNPPSIEDWVRAVSDAIVAACQKQQQPLPKLLCEPGRSLIGSAGITAYTLGSRKDIPGVRTYIAIDGGMSDNPRPITYQARYQAVLANRMFAPMTEKVTIAGKHCESGDILLKDIQLPESAAGDILVVMGTGAYNYSQSSNYNRLSRPAAVLVSDAKVNVILKRETYQDLVRQDCLPLHIRANQADV